jgi:hypothetical protein
MIFDTERPSFLALESRSCKTGDAHRRREESTSPATARDTDTASERDLLAGRRASSRSRPGARPTGTPAVARRARAALDRAAVPVRVGSPPPVIVSMLSQVGPQCKPRLEGSKSRTVPARFPRPGARRDGGHRAPGVSPPRFGSRGSHSRSAGRRGAHPLSYADAPASGLRVRAQGGRPELVPAGSLRSAGPAWPRRVAIVPVFCIIHYWHRRELFLVCIWTHVRTRAPRGCALGARARTGAEMRTGRQVAGLLAEKIGTRSISSRLPAPTLS